MSEPSLLTEWSRLVVATLAACGVEDVVTSPGSRSTPLVCALCEMPSLRLHTLIDERSAGFFALGQARATGLPSVLVCTSGSAVANYFPAIVEAAQSRLPLLVVSADRPFELMDASAAQTLDQTKLFGGYVRTFFELGMPESEPFALSALQRRIAQAVFATRWPEPGVVHVNVRARKPLEPVRETTPSTFTAHVAELIQRGPTGFEIPEAAPSSHQIARLALRLTQSRRTLIACGPMPMNGTAPAPAIGVLARRSGGLLLVEAGSQLRFALPADLAGDHVCDGFEALLDHERGRALLEPELIVQFGRPLVSTAWERFVAARPHTERWLVADGAAADPLATARETVVGHAGLVAEAIVRALESQEPAQLAAERTAWRARVAQANRAVWNSVDAAVDAGGTLTEPQVVRAVVQSLHANDILALGNSLPIRDVDWFCPASRAKLRVSVQRGTNGIDGVLSATAGVASATESPTTLLIGDIGFLHDVGGLWAARQVRSPLVIVVVDNGGGRIFEQLPLGERSDLPPQWLDRWITPHALPLAHAGELYAIAHATVETLDELRTTLTAARQRASATLVVARVAPSSVRTARRAIAATLEANFPSDSADFHDTEG